MTVFVNDKPYDVGNSSNLSEVADFLKLPTVGVALAINNQMIPRSKWQETKIEDQTKIILIKAVCGG